MLSTSNRRGTAEPRGQGRVAHPLERSVAVRVGTFLCLHEPPPKLIEEAARYRYGETAADEIRDLLTESRPAELDDRVYGEAANRLALVVPELVRAFPKSRFVWLVRDGRDVVSSTHQRGWYDPERAKDTVWERWRIRGDLVGAVEADQWEHWSPFQKTCWLWRWTNEVIETDLATLPEERHRMLRLENLEDEIDSVADFLQIEPAPWAITKRNARVTDGAGETIANEVDTLVTPDSWTEDQRAIFEQTCGSLMDRLYPEWQDDESTKSAPSPAPAVVGTSDEGETLAAIRADIAELRVLRGELNVLAEYQRSSELRQRGELTRTKERADRLSKALDSNRLELDSNRLELDSNRLELDSNRLELREARQDLRARKSRSEDLERDRDKLARRLTQTRESTSFRLGHTIVRALNLPRRLIRGPGRVVRRGRASVKAAARRPAHWIASNPRCQAFILCLPPRVKGAINEIGRRLTADPNKGSAVRQSGRIGRTRKTGLRVAFGPGSPDRFRSDGVDALDLTGAGTIDLPTNIDLALVDADHEPGSDDLAAVKARGASVVLIGGRVPPIPTGFTPEGFERESEGSFVAACSTNTSVPNPVPGRAIEVIPLDPLLSVDDPVAFRDLRRHVGLIDDPSHHDDQLRRAMLLTRCAAVGLPVAASDCDELRGLLPDAIVDAFSGTSARSLTDPDERALTSHRQRGLVHDHFSMRGSYSRLLTSVDRPGLSNRSVSVIVVSNRPAMLPRWSALAAAQTHPHHEIVFVCHGDMFEPDELARAGEILGDQLSIIRAPASLTLGEALNLGVESSGGELIVKWDDDDLYGPDHLEDLTRAYEYSGADLVGKAAEFVHLAGPGVTIRRLKSSTEAWAATIGGRDAHHGPRRSARARGLETVAAAGRFASHRGCPRLWREYLSDVGVRFRDDAGRHGRAPHLAD